MTDVITVAERTTVVATGDTTADVISVGILGPPGASGPPGAGIAWRGVWSPSAHYVVGDGVEYAGSSYIATAVSTNAQPDASPSTWSLFAAGGSASTFTFTQNAPAATWTINHGLGVEPAITVADTAGTRILGYGCTFPDLNTAVLHFNPPLAGTASLI